MQKTILITGATDGIGLETAKMLTAEGHTVLLHGRNPDKLAAVASKISESADNTKTISYVADLSCFSEVEALANTVLEQNDRLDVLINNAGVFKTPTPITEDGLDVRFVVNTLAPYLLTQRLLPLFGPEGRVINLSSAAQSSVDLDAMAGRVRLTEDFNAYAQSKLAITMWSRHLAQSLKGNGPSVIAVNPGSLLATKMVKEGFGMAGNDIGIGANILVRAALDEAFASASGQYFDNDVGQFASPHADALDARKNAEIVRAIIALLAR